jgi:hypothetical protein
MNRPDFIHQVTGYATSKDYVRLVALARKQSGVCIVDYTTQCRDTAHTIWEDFPTHSAECFQVSGRGTCYIHANTAEEFIQQCHRSNLEFIEPVQIVPAFLELPNKPGMWWWQDFAGDDWQMVEAYHPEKSKVKNKLILGAANRNWFGYELPGFEDKLRGKWVFVNPPLLVS